MWKKIIMVLLVPFLILTISHGAQAKTGDFYKDHKKEFDKMSLSEADLDLIKKYDYDTNSFDCGMFDINCHVGGFFYKSAIGLVKGGYKTIQSFVVKPNEITGNKTFKKYKSGLATLSHLMLMVFLLWHIMKIVATRYAESEDGLIAFNDKLLYLFTGGILLGIYDHIINYILQFQQYAVQGIMSDPVDMEDIAVMVFRNGAGYGYLIALILAFILLIFSIAFMYRFVLFGFLYVTGVVAIPTILNDEYNYFSIWLRQMINNGVTLFGQALCFSLGFTALIKNNAFGQGSSFTVAMAFFILALCVPSILGQLGASSGTSRTIGTALRYVSRR